MDVPSPPTFTVSNWIALLKNSRASMIGFTFYMITQGHMLQSRPGEKLLELGWVTIPHPAYSPDLAPTVYHLFRSLSNHLREKKFDDESSLKMDLADFFSQKSKDFYERRIFSLSERWRQVVDSDGAYIIEN